MRKATTSGSFWLCLLLNVIFHLEGLIPTAILLLLHFCGKISLWWSLLSLILWILWILCYQWILSWANRCGNTPQPKKENRNPYSASNKGLFR